MDRNYLERLVTLKEIKEAIWDCGSSKAPSPDGFSFAFVKKYWDIIQKDMFDFINSFFVSSEMPHGANSSFFTLIPKVNNPTLITDFRLISLIDTHYKIIAEILANRASIMVNGSPTSEFSINCGLRQGDPLSPFLFILVMEGLHNAFTKAVVNGLISGININNSTINISHLFFVDDVIITIGWNARYLENIIRVLHVFYLASGLKINILKSNIYGIWVNEEEVYNMASNAGYTTGNIPFNYLGLLIGSNMKSIASWKVLVDRFRSRLSTWKANLLSIRGRLTLIKSVLGSLGIYYLLIFRAPKLVLNDLERIRSNFFLGGNQDDKKMAWVKWPIILNSFDKGGLNIGSLKAFNLALLQKWCWRMFSSPNDLWVKVVKAFHGYKGGFDNNRCSFKGIWANIVGSSNFLHLKGVGGWGISLVWEWVPRDGLGGGLVLPLGWWLGWEFRVASLMGGGWGSEQVNKGAVVFVWGGAGVFLLSALGGYDRCPARGEWFAYGGSSWAFGACSVYFAWWRIRAVVSPFVVIGVWVAGETLIELPLVWDVVGGRVGGFVAFSLLAGVWPVTAGVAWGVRLGRRVMGSHVGVGVVGEDSSLWYRVIKAMFGDGGALDNTGKFARSSTWTTIVFMWNAVNLCTSKEKRKFSNLRDVNSVILSVSNDRWIWSLDSSGEFSIKSTRLFIDDHLLLAVGAPTRWVSEVPLRLHLGLEWSLDKLSKLGLICLLRGIEKFFLSLALLLLCRESCCIFFSLVHGPEHYTNWLDGGSLIARFYSHTNDWLNGFNSSFLKVLRIYWKGSFTLCGG
ncbi:putative RNA-directed DNA polymerase, eukaryota, reverse transcriptase zinc-binding domain protein [Tanacetum coccineum]